VITANTLLLSKCLCCLDSRPVVGLFTDDDDDNGDDGDIFKQMSSGAAAENAQSTAAKHKVMHFDVSVAM